MANDLRIAGLTLDVVGAVLLLRGLAFQPARRYAEENPGPLYPRSANPKQDLAHAESAAEAVVGATLLALGFVAQLFGNGIVHDNGTSEALTYAGLAFALGLACLFLPVVRSRRERDVYRAQHELYGAYVPDADEAWRQELAERGRDPALVDEWKR